MKTRENYWREKIERWEASGQSCRQYSTAEGISYWSMRDWIKKLKKTEKTNFVKLQPACSPMENNQDIGIELIIQKNLIIRITADFDGKLLRKLLGELGVEL